MDSKPDHHKYCTGGYNPDDIVISGIAGRFPECENVGQLSDALFSKKTLIVQTGARFEKGACDIPFSSCGTLKDLDKLDAEFFCIPQRTANHMDPAGRKILEVSYEAIADSGYDPYDLRGMRIGVYNAAISDDAQQLVFMDGIPDINSFLRCMLANRTSYAFDFHGPSVTMDTGCSSSGVAIWSAVKDLMENRIEAAVVNACQMDLDPRSHAAYIQNGVQSLTGNSIPFDANTDGIQRTEATVAFFIQKASVARRSYATILSVKFFGSGYVMEGINVPSQTMQVKLSLENLQEAGLTTDDIDFVEAHGTGTIVGDRVELNAISQAYCLNKTRPLYIGSIKSNVGHAEAASAMCGIVKALFAFETGFFPPNYRFFTPNPTCPALLEGKIRVVTEPMLLRTPYIPVNSFGFGGTLVQLLLKQNPIVYSKKETVEEHFPQLVLYPATTEEAITHLFNYIQKSPHLRQEFFALLHKLSFTPPSLKPFRGYGLFKEECSEVVQIQRSSLEKRPVWFVFTGMGCQWTKMGLQLMKIKAFADSMNASAATLKTVGCDLFAILSEKGRLEANRQIVPAFIGIAAIQIALVDVLRALDINPDGILGHSTGELVAAYADGCCTAEQTILSAYWRGKSTEQANLPIGSMAAVGLSLDEAIQRCPEGVYAACDNADDSVTISGLKENVEKFIEKLKSENIFARTVDAYGFAFHSVCIKPAATILKDALSKILTKPKVRSSKWITTSHPESNWNSEVCKTAGPDYFTNNLISRVRFNEASKKIPSDAIVIEIGPHFLLLSLLRRSVGPDASYIGLMKRNDENSLDFFLESLGKLYNEGMDPKVERLYPSVQFPVPRATPIISDLIKWNYSQTYKVQKWAPQTGELSQEYNLEKKDNYLMDHRIDGRSLFPATGYIMLAWEALASKLQKKFDKVPVRVQNFKIHKATIISNQATAKFFVNLLGNSGTFEVSEGNSLVASGEIYEWKNIVFSELPPSYQCDSDSAIIGTDVYNELKMSGYEYGPAFQGLREIDMDGTQGLVSWQDRWIPFLDSLLLFFGLLHNSNEFCLPTGAHSIKINPAEMKQFIENSSESQKGVPVNFNAKTQTCRSVGVEIEKLGMDPAPHRVNENPPTLEQYKFVPYIHTYTPEKEPYIYLSKYVNACNKTLDKIGKALGLAVNDFKFPINSNNQNDREFGSDLEEEQQLLTILKQIANNPNCTKKGRKELFSTYLNKMGQDVLNRTLVQEYPLRILIETISENSFRKLNVFEVNREMPAVLPAITAIVKKYSYIKFKNSTFVCSKDSELDPDVVEECSIHQYNNEMLNTVCKEKDIDLVISSFLWGSRDDLEVLILTLSKMVKENGFILFFFKEKTNPAEKFLCTLFNEDPKTHSSELLEKILKERKLIVLSKLCDKLGSSVYLLKSPTSPPPSTILKITESNTYNWVDQVKVFLSKNASDTLWLISEEDVVSGIVGMVNCIKQEPGGERIKCVFMPKKTKDLPAFSFAHSCYKELLRKGLLMNVWKDGSWGSFRHVLIKNSNPLRCVEHSYVNCKKYGDLSSFEWLESHVKYAKVTDEKLVHIYYSALNFKDVMLATGKLSIGTSKIGNTQVDDSVLGLEFSGRDNTGRRVAGFIKSRGMATSTLADPLMCIDVPDKWTLEQAATVPVVYATCYYALAMRARLRRGESILIHSGTGGIGLAAINIALSMNCEIFTTVGNNEKRKYLKEKYPQIKDENIGCSRDTTFEKMIMERTSGKGVNVVLNSLADDKFTASIRCVARHGRFVEIGKYDLSLDRKIGLKIFLQNISFYGVFLDQLFEKTPESKASLIELMQLINDGIKHEVVKPLDAKVFSRKEIEESFRYMARGVHVGKVLIKVREEERDKHAIPKILAIPALPKTYFYANKSYIVIGGLGGFGIEVTKWILSRGGRNIVLTSRFGARTPYHNLCLRRWTKAGYNVQVSTLNVAHADQAEKLLRETSHVAPVGGIFNSAVVLKDAFMDCQSAESYEEVCAPKATATIVLDDLSRRLCPALDYFVCFSSVSCGRGNAGQTNYGYANSVMERVCEERRSLGLHGLAIQWGIIGDVGVVHRHMGDDAMIAGVSAQSVKSCLEALDSFCQIKFPVVSSYVNAASARKTNQTDVLTQLVKILGGKTISDINVVRSLGEMGIDSLVGVEVKQLLESSCDVSLTMQEIFDLKIGDVSAMIEKAEIENTSDSKVSQLFTTSSIISLPISFINDNPVVALNNQTKGAPVFIVKISDDDLSQFRTLGEVFNQPVYALLWTKDSPTSDIKALATWYLQLIENKTHNPFHLVGYSLGGCVAFEMALQSEKTKKKIETLSLLNGSSQLRSTLSKDKEPKNAEIKAIIDFLEQFAPEGVPSLEDQLSNVKNLEQRIGITLNFLMKYTSQPINKSDVADAITSFIQKSIITRSYLPDDKLSTDIALIEDPTKVLANDITETKDLFSQICKGKINIHRVFSPNELENTEAMKKIAALLTHVH